MEVKINKEIRDYTEAIYFGLNLRQFIFSVLACIMAVIFYFLLKDKLGIETLSWVCILIWSPFAAIGFVKYNGMTFEKFVVAYLKSKILTPTYLTFKPKNYYLELLELKEKEEKRKNKKGVKIYENIKKLIQRRSWWI